ncbi:MAG: hypothetical protein FD130_1899 [Halothiobacillaceae bacterium]|nr:MAG: hypothetical protein FD130_1899 [Halothiobacillaceae bacterium]
MPFHHHAWQKDTFTDEVGDEAVGRTVVEVVGTVPLLDMTLMHDGDLIGDGEGFMLIVGNHQRGGAFPFDDVAHVMAEPFTEGDIEVGEGFVEQ